MDLHGDMNDNWKNAYVNAFGRHLHKLRLERGITQLMLSRKSGISLSHISRMERGKRSPTADVLYYLAIGLGVEAEKLLDFPFVKGK